MGESKLKLAKSQELLELCAGVQTAAGRVQVRWESESAATPMGQLAYFIELLTLTGLWSRWQEGFPLPYVSPNAATKAEVLGTWMLSILSGHRRYSHVTAIGCDGVNPGLLGMNKVISEDALRRALTATPEAEGIAWLDRHLEESVAPLLDAPWILDIDTTVKPLYGKQEGAVVCYNPKKPGRPSHSYHTYLMAGLPLVVGAEVKAGGEHSGSHSLPGLLKILDALPIYRRPRIVRGDCGFGSDTLMGPLEDRSQSYLFKLRLSKNVKRHIARVFWDAGWTDAGQGWEGKDGQLCLKGWKQTRRVVVLRRPLKGEMLIAQGDDAQGLLGFVEADRKAGKRTTGYEYAVLVTNLDHEILSLGQLYRDRADAEIAFDELKNQWGWGGFTTHDLHRCQLSARAVALIYNWWSLFVRLASPEARREAITSRPWLMSSIGRKTEHAGQTTITLTGLHAHFGKARDALTRVSAMLKAWTAPTLLELTGVAPLAAVNGKPARAFHGVSMAPVLFDARAPSARNEQYYECWSNRTFYRDGWLARSLQKRGEAIDLDNWTLHHLDRDFSESEDLRSQHPQKLKELTDAFDAAAWQYFVYPLDNRDRREKFADTPPGAATHEDQPRAFLPGMQTVHRAIVFPLIASRSFRIRVRFEHELPFDGVLWAIGDPTGGMVMCIDQGHLRFHYNGFGERTAVAGPRLEAGPHVAVLDYAASEKRQGRGRILLDDAAVVDWTPMSPTMVLYGVLEGLDIGLDRRGPVLWDLYEQHGAFGYKGSIHDVTIEPGARVPM